MRNVRKLTKSDAQIFRSIRLESLERHPEAFQSSHDAEASKGLEFFAERLEGSTVFGGFEDTELLGVAGFRRLEQTKVSHKRLSLGNVCAGEGKRNRTCNFNR